MTTPDVDCPFCAIAAGAHAADVVYRDSSVVAFLDRRPLFPGHVLIVPTSHIETLADAPDEAVCRLMKVVKATSAAMKSGLGADGSFVANNNEVSQSVPHLHFHVVPRRFHDGLKHFFWPRAGYESDEQRTEIARVLADAIAAELAGKRAVGEA